MSRIEPTSSAVAVGVRASSWRAIAFSGVALLLAGCGTVCDDASTICGFDTVEASTDCTGANECASTCIVDWDNCDVNDPDRGVSKCIADCLAQSEGT